APDPTSTCPSNLGARSPEGRAPERTGPCRRLHRKKWRVCQPSRALSAPSACKGRVRRSRSTFLAGREEQRHSNSDHRFYRRGVIQPGKDLRAGDVRTELIRLGVRKLVEEVLEAEVEDRLARGY